MNRATRSIGRGAVVGASAAICLFLSPPADAATDLLRPNVGVSNTFTVVGAGTAWDALNDGVAQPSGVGVTDYIADSGYSGRVSEMGLTSRALGGAMVTGGRAWYYAGNGNASGKLKVEVLWGGAVRASYTLSGPAAWGWRSLDAVPDTQAAVDDLRIRFTSLGTSPGMGVRAAYFELVTGPTCLPVFGSFGIDSWPAGCWRPYAATSPFNRPLPANPQLVPDSDAMVDYMTGLGPPIKLRANDHETTEEYGQPVYWSQPSDPVFTVSCDAAQDGNCSLPNGTQVRIPDAAQPAGGSDGHLAVIDQSTGWEYDFWRVMSKPQGGGTLLVGGSGKTRIDGDGLGSGGTAAGFGNYAGLIRPEELQAGQINHALFGWVNCSNGSHVYPAVANGQTCGGTNAPPMGTHIQLDMSDAEISALNATAWKKTIFRAMARYGMFMGDTGGATWGVKLQSDSTYTSFGRSPRLVDFAVGAGWQPYADPDVGRTVYVGSFQNDIAWGDKLRIVAPCVSQATC